MSKSVPRRRAEPPAKRRTRETSDARTRAERFAGSRAPVVIGVVVILAGLGALVTCVAEIGPAWLCGAGSVAVVTAYSWALAARTGMPVEDLRRGQELLDEVAVLVGRPATPEPNWWRRP